ncbi:hypothetical protein ACFO1B_44135 [Dactylosporangium siamense]|nr:hypothetical protein [Dactylosporangium siamense]
MKRTSRTDQWTRTIRRIRRLVMELTMLLVALGSLAGVLFGLMS